MKNSSSKSAEVITALLICDIPHGWRYCGFFVVRARVFESPMCELPGALEVEPRDYLLDELATEATVASLISASSAADHAFVVVTRAGLASAVVLASGISSTSSLECGSVTSCSPAACPTGSFSASERSVCRSVSCPALVGLPGLVGLSTRPRGDPASRRPTRQYLPGLGGLPGLREILLAGGLLVRKVLQSRARGHQEVVV